MLLNGLQSEINIYLKIRNSGIFRGDPERIRRELRGLKNQAMDKIRARQEPDGEGHRHGKIHFEPFIENERDKKYERERDGDQDRHRVFIEFVHITKLRVRKYQAQDGRKRQRDNKPRQKRLSPRKPRRERNQQSRNQNLGSEQHSNSLLTKMVSPARFERTTPCLAYRTGLLRPQCVAVWTMSSPFQACSV